MGSRIAKRLVSDRRGFVAGVASTSSFAETPSCLLVCGVSAGIWSASPCEVDAPMPALMVWPRSALSPKSPKRVAAQGSSYG
jgi:hypothetical protein